MKHKFVLVLGSAILAGSVLSTGYAQDQQQPGPQGGRSGPAMSGDTGMMAHPGMAAQMQQATPSGHDMAGGKGMMGQPEMVAQMQRMMANNPEMMAQMVQMMENCNKVMESMMQQSPAAQAPKKGG